MTRLDGHESGPLIDRLLVATRNHGKLAEIRAALAGAVGQVVGLDDVEGIPEIDEDGRTFVENATKKAEDVRRIAGGWVLADDSGLEVDALGGVPGVYSARYATPADRERLDVRFDEGQDTANNAKLLDALAGVSPGERAARFRAVLALASPDGAMRTFEGACEGTILEAPRGDRGFGYDPLFQPEGESRAMAEIPIEEKNSISHRGQALAALRAWVEAGGASGQPGS